MGWENYIDVKEWWDEEIDKRSRKKKVLRISCGTNNWLCKYLDGSFKLVYHETAIVAYNPDGSIDLDTDGYNTVMTKKRMNFFLPMGFTVMVRQKIWYLVPMWMANPMADVGIGEKEIKKRVWDHAKQFNKGECSISAEEMLLYALGKVQA